MKALFVVAALACWMVLGPLAQAQQAPAGGGGGEHSMTGCLKAGAAAGKFQLTNLERGPATVEIAETTANLAPHVGHKIEITGTRIADAPGHTMKVTAMKMVAAACP